MQAAGFFHKLETRANLPYRSFGTWLGNPTTTLQAREIINIIRSEKLIDNVNSVGSYLYDSLRSLSSRYPNSVRNLRGEGKGTFIAFDAADPQSRDRLLLELRKTGVNLGGCGAAAVRLRPMLIFRKHHADIFLEKLEQVLQKL